MTESELDILAAKIAERLFRKLSVPSPAGDEYPEKLSRTQAARFVGGKPFKRGAQASGTDHALLRELRVKPLLENFYFHGNDTRCRDYFSKTALAAALAARN